MPAQWLNSPGDIPGRISAALAAALQKLSQPDQARRLRQAVLLLLALWVVVGCARLIWALVPVSAEQAEPPARVVNPVSTARTGQAADPVDIDTLRSWHLFGEAGAAPEVAVVQEEVAAASARDGIEEGARETRLPLVLRGVVASTEDGLGHAIIESKSQQAVYAVGDSLPVGGRVTLAKVMPQQVVLDNGGDYELLVLFEESDIGKGAAGPAPRPVARNSAREIDKRDDAEITRIARGYREQLFSNPQSLVSVVNVSAVREGGQLRGYRVRPGREREQFEQLGFKTGDLVTAVNGISLDNPANTMTLYNAMRSAGEVVFDIERDNQALSISVSLGE